MSDLINFDKKKKGFYDGLENMVKNNTAFSEEIVQYLMKQIVDAIRYLHKKKILHRDLKLDNILINYENENDRLNNNIMKGQIKIIDFFIY